MTSVFYSYVNLANIVILSIMLVGVTQLLSIKSGKVFFSLSIAFGIAENVFDSLWNLGKTDVLIMPNALMQIINSCYFMTLCASAYFWFVFSEVSFRKTLYKTRLGIILSIVPAVALFVLLAGNPFIGWLYTLDSAGNQTPTKLFYLQQLLAYIYVIVITIKHIILAPPILKNGSKYDFSILVSLCVPSIVCLIAQMLFPMLPILSSAPTFSLLSLYASLLTRSASTDRLTGLLNSDAFATEIERRTHHLKPDQKLCVMFMDIDAFKSLNDTRGHEEGNKVLRLVADVLNKGCAKMHGIASRYGGDEFAVVNVFSTDTDPETVMKMVENDIKDESMRSRGYQISMSIGYDIYDNNKDNVGNLIAKADANMYKTKGDKYMSENFDKRESGEMTLERFYLAVGGNAADSIARLGGNEAMLRKFLKKFLADNSFTELEKALDEDDTQTAFRMAHTLKGVAANLGLQRLFETAVTVTEFLRAGNIKDGKLAMPALRREYLNAVKRITELG